MQSFACKYHQGVNLGSFGELNQFHNKHIATVCENRREYGKSKPRLVNNTYDCRF